MRRGLDRNWIFSRGQELMKLNNPKLTKKAIAERLGLHVSTFCQIMNGDGRKIKRKEKVEV